MTSVELVLLVIIIILVIILIQQNFLESAVSKRFSKHRDRINKILAISKKIYNIFKKVRRFSLINIFKNKFSRLYLIAAIGVSLGKIILYFKPQIENNLPVVLNKSLDFLIVSAAWEIICVVTKTIEDRRSK